MRQAVGCRVVERMILKPGDVLEAAVWLDGRETAKHRSLYEADLREQLARVGDLYGMVIGPLIWAEKQHGEDRVPRVPDHIAGPDVRLLVAEAHVVCRMPDYTVGDGSFVHELDPADLARLREFTRHAHAWRNPGERRLTDAECDAVIERIGPETALRTLKEAVDRKLLH